MSTSGRPEAPLGAEGHELHVDTARDARRATAPDRVTLGRGRGRGRETEVDRIRLAEGIRHGQQVESFVVEALRDGVWTEVTAAGAIGASRIPLLPAPVRARRWRLRVTRSRSAVRMAEFALYRSQV